MEKELLALQTPVFSWKEDAELTKACDFQQYRVVLSKAADERFSALMNPPCRNWEEITEMLEVCKTVSDASSYQDKVTAVINPLVRDSLRPLYEYGKRCDENVVHACVAECQRSAQKARDAGLWSLGEYPEEIARVLYSNE